MERKALLVGINRYREPGNDLRGCVNDVRQVDRLLRGSFGFPPRGVRRLEDGEATKASILSGLAWLAEGTGPGGTAVFHFSGHGSQVPDRSGGEEEDRLDEILCPHDMDWEDPLTDDALAEALAPLSPGTHLAVILDCCHSGTALRELPPGPPGRFLAPRPPSPAHLPGGAPPAPRRVRRPLATARGRAEGVLLAACRDDQSSADAWIGGGYHGAHTWFLCRALEAAAGRLHYRGLVERMARDLRARRFPQEPQLEGPDALLARQAFGIRPDGGNRDHSAA